MCEDNVKSFVRSWLRLRELPEKETCLEGDLGLSGMEAEDFMQDFAQHFGVKLEGFVFDDHFESEGMGLLSFFHGLGLRLKAVWTGCSFESLLVPYRKKDVRVGDLIESVRRGRWSESRES